jgi:cytochrome c oxidase assembly protein subunit 15
VTVHQTTSRSPLAAGAGRRGRDWLRAALVANLILQIVIILTGGLVRLTGSGLGCPTWPQCVPGSFTPVAQQAQGIHSAIEFGNRLMTFVLAAVAIALVVLAHRQVPHRGRFVRLSYGPILGIVAQAVLGGIIVLAHLDPKTVSPHFLLSLVLVSYSTWLVHRYDVGDGRRELAVAPVLYRLTQATAVVAAVVMVLGTAVTGSGPHSGDANTPVRFGFDPRATSWLHADAVMLFVGLVVAVMVAARLVDVPARFRYWWTVTFAVCLAQGLIGYTQFFTGLPAALVAVHLVGSALLTVAVTYGVMAASAWVPAKPGDVRIDRPTAAR